MWGCGAKASVSARGQADSAHDSVCATGTTGTGVGAGGGAKKLLSACELEGRGAGMAGAAGCSDFGERKLLTRAIRSCG